MSTAKSVWKMTYINVVIRTGIAALFIGAFVAWFFNNAQVDYLTLATGCAVIILMQGIATHAFDTLVDTDNPESSSFRGSVKEAFTPEQLKYIFKLALTFALIVMFVGTFIIGRWFIIPIFALGAMCIVLYAVTHIESYSFTAFGLCTIAGFLTQFDIDFTIGINFFMVYGPLFSVFVMMLFVYRIGQLIYRIDDYIRLMSEKQLVAYYRHNLRKIHHPIQLGIIAIISWALGWWWIAWPATLIELGLWYFTHHTTCNNVHCFKNNIRLMETGKRACKGKLKHCLGSCPKKCKTSGPISWKTIVQDNEPEEPRNDIPF